MRAKSSSESAMIERSTHTASKTGDKTCDTAAGAIPARSPRSSFYRIDALHQTVGNQSVQRLFQSGAIQPKLIIGKPNDIYEQEADRVAEQVMSLGDKGEGAGGKGQQSGVGSLPSQVVSRGRESGVKGGGGIIQTKPG